MTPEQELDLLRRENAALRTALVAISDLDPYVHTERATYVAAVRRLVSVALAR